MKKIIKNTFILLTVAFCLSHFVFYGQQSKIDSLQDFLRTATEDTIKVNTLNEVAMEFRINNPDTCIYYAQKALTLSEKINFKKGIAEAHVWIGTAFMNTGKYNIAFSYLFKALGEAVDKKIIARIYNNIALIYNYQGNYPEALKNNFVALKIRLQVGDKKGIGVSYNNIGNVLCLQGNYPEALKNYFASLKRSEEIIDKQGMTNSLGNIGTVYYIQGNYSEALKIYFASLKIKEEIGDQGGIANSYNNIGSIYYIQGNFPEALKNFVASLKINESKGDKQGIAVSYSNIGSVYMSQGNYLEALKKHFASLKIGEEIGDKETISSSYRNIGNVYSITGQAKVGKHWLEKALKLSKEIGSKNAIKENYFGLAKTDSVLAASPQTSLQKKVELAMSALENYKMYVIYKDSLINEETIKKSEREKNQYEFDKKEAEAEVERVKRETVAEAERRKQQIILWSVCGGLLLVILFASFVFRSLRITKKQKQIIEGQKFQIVESINYSKKIQNSLLPSIESMHAAIPGLFLFYEPKAIVSGDFYYFKEFGNYTLIACVDCTGHGVPGGFMSTLGSLLLDKIANDGSMSPSQILNRLSDEIIRVLHQQSGGEIQDGMDLSICLIDKKNKRIEFSGARNGIIIVSNNTAKRYKASSLPVGGNYMKKGVPIVRNFQTEHIDINPGDWIYMYTDGFMEQRGGVEGIPMNFTQYESKLISLSAKESLEEKRTYLQTGLDNWRGVNERDDDVLIIGFQVV